jgi:hypothetical protein
MAHDDAQDLLDAAMSGVAQTDSALEGARVTKWYVVAEHELPDDGGRMLSIFRSAQIKPWDALGMLSFATTIEQGVVYQGDDEDSE